jgi:hypothetical protein
LHKRLLHNPEAREKAAEAARAVIEKTKNISEENDRAYATGWAVHKAFNKLKGN